MNPAVGKSGARHRFHQLAKLDIRVFDEHLDDVDDLAEIVRRHVGRHPDRDPRRSVDEQIGEGRRQHQRFRFGAVVVGAEIDGFFLDVPHHLVRELVEPDLGVPHRGGRIAVDGPEVSLPVDERVAHGEVLRHANDRVVDRGIAVGVVLADDRAHRARGLAVRLVRRVAGVVHGVQHAAVHGLQPVADVGERPPDDHAHRVIEIRTAHLLFDIYGESVFLGVH